MNFEAARFNMIYQQIRPYDVLDDRVLERIGQVPREDFVPPEHRTLAFVDTQIPLGRGEFMLPPKLEARMLQELELKPTDRVLEIGTGSAYFTALLAGLSAFVYTVEIVPEFKMQAETRLAAHGIKNVTLDLGDGAQGWPRHGLYDAIVLTGSVPVLAPGFLASLAPGGRLVAIVGRAPVMELKRFDKLDGGLGVRESTVIETACPALHHAEPAEQFVF